MIKSKIALEFTVERLLKGFHSCYLWTFTLPETMSRSEFLAHWDMLRKPLTRMGFQGVRVFELHPGGHGWHVHVISRFRHNVNLVRHYTAIAGWGRINVKRIPANKACYVAKYIGKSKREGCEKRMRLWAGLRFVTNHVRDIQINGGIGQYMRQLSETFWARYISENIQGYARTLYKMRLCDQLVHFGEILDGLYCGWRPAMGEVSYA